MPISDQVPALMKIESAWRKGTAATAEPVSWVATAITVVPSRAPPSIVPSCVPGSTTSGRTRVGTWRRSSRSCAQACVRGSKHCVVVAFVNSVDRLPHRRPWRRSGIMRSFSASSSAGSFSSAIAASSKIELIGISWMPVRS
jgi:hypothetical protein